MKAVRTALVLLLPWLVPACAMDGPAHPDFAAADETAEERRVYLAMVRRLHERGQARAALAFLDEYELRYPRDAEAWTLRGGALLDIGDLAAAEAAFLWLHGEGYRPVADFGRGRVEAARGRWPEAIRHFTAAAELAPSNPRYLNNLGYAQLAVGWFDAAYGALARAVQLDPANVVTRNNFILAAHGSGRAAEVERMIRTLDDGERRKVAAMLDRWNPAATP
jgi:Flp pilus assembly protein TadD